MKPKILLCLALVLSGVLVGFVSNVRADELATNAEPRYLDKSLSEWIPLARLSGEVNIPLDARAFDALRDIGTNALPWLLRWIQSDKPETARLGLEGLGLLGPIAKPGIPELVRLVNDWPSSSAWSNAIPALAAIRDTNYIPYALPFLLSAATNTDAPAEFRVQALQSIYTPNAGPFLLTGATNTDGSAAYWLQALQSIFYQPIQPIAASASTKAALSVFVACLQDKDWRVAAKAADGLDFGVSTIDPVVAVPALAACLASHTNRPVGSTAGKVENDPANWSGVGDVAVRGSVARALGAFGAHVLGPSALAQDREAMLRAMPVLVKSLSDEDWRVAMWAARSLGDAAALEPDIAVPALIKSTSDADWHVAMKAADALGDAALEPELAVPALVKSLDYPQRDVQRSAAEALGKFGAAARSAVPALTKKSQDDPHGYVGFFVDIALKKIVPETKP